MADRFVWRDGAFRNRETGEPMAVPSGPLARPMVTPTMPEFSSPIDGRAITTRHERREDMKQNGCIEAGDRSATGGKIRNHAFAAKRGLQVSEEFR